jgi:hypothetical protein
MSRNRVRVAVATRREIDRHLLEIAFVQSLYLFLATALAAGLIWINT